MKTSLSLLMLTAAVLLGSVPAATHAQTLYISSHSSTSWVGAYDAKTGKTIKEKFIRSDAPPRGLAFDGGKLYVAGLGGVNVYDAKTGKLLKEALLGEMDALGLLVAGGRLYAGTDGAVRLFDAATGKPVEGFVPIKTQPMAGYSSSPGLAVSDAKLYVINSDLSVGVYDATTGAVINEALVTGLDHPYNIAVVNSRLFVTSGPAVVECDATTGKVVNTSYIPGLEQASGLCLSGYHLYVTGDPKKEVVEYDVMTDKPVAAFHGVTGTVTASYLTVSD